MTEPKVQVNWKETAELRIQEINRLKNWLLAVADVCVNHDGYSGEKELEHLVDDIRGMANKALDGESPYLSE